MAIDTGEGDTMTSLTTPRMAGHVLGILVALGHVASVGIPTASGKPGPPLAVLVIGAGLGLAVIALLTLSWRRDSREARRIAAILLVLAALGALPGMFVAGASTALTFAAGALVLVTVAAVVLLFAPQPEPEV
jgi:peptidoglycan/LPS O-acetylase OafA/YrhL